MLEQSVMHLKKMTLLFRTNSSFRGFFRIFV